MGLLPTTLHLRLSVLIHYFFSGAEVRFRPPAGFYLEKFKKSLGNFLKDKQLIDVCIDVLILPVKVYYSGVAERAQTWGGGGGHF